MVASLDQSSEQSSESPKNRIKSVSQKFWRIDKLASYFSWKPKATSALVSIRYLFRKDRALVLSASIQTGYIKEYYNAETSKRYDQVAISLVRLLASSSSKKTYDKIPMKSSLQFLAERSRRISGQPM